MEAIGKDELPDVRIVDLNSSTQNFHRLDMTVEDASNENSCLVSHYQWGRDDGI